MRNWDNWLRYQDNDRNPLHGCIQFMVKDGNTVAPIYDSEGTALANPQVTDTYGRTKYQVFIDTDVIAYFYKYVGEGVWSGQEDIDTSDVSKWSLQYTSENTLDILANITSDTVVSIGTIEALRGVDIDGIPVVDGKKVITLLGYFNSGDKEPINYYWNPESTEQDNGGSVIASNNHITGRWIMVQPTEHVDSRHFGAFPSNSMNMQDQTYEIGCLFAYCSIKSLRPFFNGSTDYSWFKYTNLNVIVDAIDVSDGTKFMDQGSNTIQGEWNGNPLFNLSNTNIAAKEVKTSWGARLFVNPEHVIIDDDNLLLQTTYSGCTVDLNVNTNKVLSFTNCTVNLNKSLGSVSAFTNCIINSKNQITAGCYFTNCKLTEDMFYGSPYIHVDLNCIADFNDFDHKELMWLRIKEQQQQINYDWEGKLTQQNPWENVVDTDRWLINYKSTNLNAVLKESDNPHTYFIENCAGTITLEGKAANTYFFKNCEMNVKFASGFNANASIRLQGSTINIEQDRVNLYALNGQDSVITGTGSFDTQYAYLYNTVQSVPVYCGYCDVKDCNIGSTIQVYGINQDTEIIVDTDPAATGTHAIYHVNRIISGNFVNNFVGGQIEIGTIDYQDPHIALEDLVRGMTIKDNVGLSANPIVVHNSLSNIYDNYNIYTYSGNTGTMDMRTNNITCNLITTVPVGTGGVVISRGDAMYYAYTNDTPDSNTHVFQAKFFTIGTKNVHIAARVDYSGNMANMGMMVGTLMYLTDSGTHYPGVKKVPGVPYMWYVKNTVMTTGVSSATEGDSFTFNVVQI